MGAHILFQPWAFGLFPETALRPSAFFLFPETALGPWAFALFPVVHDDRGHEVPVGSVRCFAGRPERRPSEVGTRISKADATPGFCVRRRCWHHGCDTRGHVETPWLLRARQAPWVRYSRRDRDLSAAEHGELTGRTAVASIAVRSFLAQVAHSNHTPSIDRHREFLDTPASCHVCSPQTTYTTCPRTTRRHSVYRVAGVVRSLDPITGR
jgi:hypothetical protein